VDVHDYLIDQEGLDWEAMVADWVPPFPEQFTVWLVNRFGDIFAVYEDGSVNWLATDTGKVTRVASSEDEFLELLDVDENANDWLMIEIVDDLVEAGKILVPGQCYGYKVPPILGGAYALENVEPTDLSVNYTFLSQIYRQTSELPDGTKISNVSLS